MTGNGTWHCRAHALKKLALVTQQVGFTSDPVPLEGQPSSEM